MDVCFRILWHREVDDTAQIIYVDAACGNVGGDKHGKLALFEVFDNFKALGLGDLSVQSFNMVLECGEFFRNFIHIGSGAAEDQCVDFRHAFNGAGESIDLVFALDLMIYLLGKIGIGSIDGGAGDLKFGTHKLGGDIHNLFGHSSREHQHPFIRIGQTEDLADVIDKTHIQHLVSFIEDRKLELIELQRFAAVKVHHAAGGADDHIHAALEQTELDLDRLTAVERGNTQRFTALKRLQFSCDLDREFAGRSQDQCARSIGTFQFLQNRQAESGGFSGSGQCLTDDIFFSGKQQRDGKFLDLSRFFEALFHKCFKQIVCHSESGECVKFAHWMFQNL